MMIKIKLLIPLLVLLSLAIYGQKSNEPFKNANTILVETKLESNDAFIKWGRHLAQNGFSIEKSDNIFYTLSTGPKDTSRFNYDFILNSTVTDSGAVIIRIKWRLKSSSYTGKAKTEFYDWEYANGKNNIQNIIYEDIIPTIRSFGSFAINYQKR